MSGCTPAGPRAVLKGERLLKQGRVEEAVARLEQGVGLLPREARAWNLLGLAYHAADRPADAESAYRKAVAFDRNLAVARFNLGCLLLEQGQVTNAVHELVTFTGLQVNSAPGWLKLGQAQLRARQPAAAERSFHQLLQLQTNSAPALNGLGVALVYRRLYPDAWRRFADALRVDPDYAPAILNAGLLAQQYLGDTNLATKAYERYVAQPGVARKQEVQAILDRWAARPAPAPDAALAAAAPQPKEPTASKPAAPVNPEPPSGSTPPQSVLAESNRVETAKRPTPSEPAGAKPAQPKETPPEPKPDPEVAAVPKPPTKPVLEDKPTVPAETPATETRPAVKVEPAAKPEVATAKSVPPSDLVPEPVAEPPRPPAQADPPEALRGVEGPRYPYYAFGQARDGDRNEAIRLLNEGINDQRALRTREALEAYRRAVEVDPSLFETHYNRGVAAFELGELGEAMRAYERALSVNPDSVPARFNFATTLQRSGYLMDAAAQLGALLEAHPDETRAHLALGNLYADSFQNFSQAAYHYRRVLELEPQHPNGTSLRFWIEAH